MIKRCFLLVNYLFVMSALVAFASNPLLPDNRFLAWDGCENLSRAQLLESRASPHALWINEINTGGFVYDQNYNYRHGIWENAYIEIAVPAWLDLGGWKIELVKNSNYETLTLQIPHGLHRQAAVTNGYAFFVIADANSPHLKTPTLPKVDFAYAGLANFLPQFIPGGIRLRRPDNTCEQAIAYDDAVFNESGQTYDGRAWAANDPEGRFVYVGADHNKGSLSRTGVGDSTNSWVYPLFPEWGVDHVNFAKNYTPCIPNGAQWLPDGDAPLELQVKTTQVNGDASAVALPGLAVDSSSNEAECSVVTLGLPVYSGGSGTAADPYQIVTKADLLYLGTNTTDYTRNFILTANIDLAGEVFTNAVIAADISSETYGYQGSAFAGFFDGQGHVISNLTINTNGAGNDYLGLFGSLSDSGAVVRNLRVENASILCGVAKYVGVVCAYNDLGIIEACSTSGSIACGARADSVGGLCGMNAQGVITESSSSVSINVAGNASRFGGLTGFNYYGAISNCYATGAVVSSGYYMGGLCGEIFGGSIVNSYSSGAVSGIGYTGGLIGLNYYGGSVDGCFWDIDASGYPASDGGTGLSTGEMHIQEILLFAGWDFVIESSNGTGDYWYMDGDGYPKLAAHNLDYDYFRLTIEGRGEVFVSEGVTVGLAAAPAQEGYVFDRWIVQPDAFSNSVDNLFSSSAIFTMPAANIALNAAYRIKSYVVNFNLNGHGSRVGGGELSQLVAHRGAAVAPVVAADEHWIFIGWSSAITNITEDLNLSAEYIAAKYELHVNRGTGAGFYTNGASVAILAGTPLETQRFTGWITDPPVYSNNVADLTSPGTTFKMPGTNVTLTATYYSPFGGGAGTVEQPWQIGTKTHFINMATNTLYYNRCFVLSKDIDLHGTHFERAVIASDIATANGFQGVPFTGVLDGNGHVISNFAVSSGSTGRDYLGLFGCLSGASCEVRNLGLEGFEIVGGDFSLFVGGICGYNSGGRIRGCYSNGSLSGAGAYLWYMGGVCGYNFGGEITQCYAAGSVSGGDEADYLGGLCGYNDGVIAECYSVAFVEADLFAYYAGGFCGRESEAGVIDACFWDIESSGRAVSAGAIGKTTAEMQMESFFAAVDWDFANIWHMNGYPALRCFSPPGTYAYWLMNNPGIPLVLRGENDSPAGDGIPNLLKYACGLSAMDPCTTADLMTIQLADSNTFSVLYYKSKTAEDVTLQPIWAESLHGSWSAVGIVTEKLGEDAEREHWKASIPMAESGFIKLRVTSE